VLRQRCTCVTGTLFAGMHALESIAGNRHDHHCVGDVGKSVHECGTVRPAAGAWTICAL